MQTKSVRIFYSPDWASDSMVVTESPTMGVDLAPLEKFYASMGERQKKSFDRFVEYWDGEGFKNLFEPMARVVSMPLETAFSNFGEELLRVNDSVGEILMIVWTIGAKLEKAGSEMMSEAGNMMNGFLLDVAGSIALYDMHRTLIEWVKTAAAGEKGKYINGEFYPGMGSMRQDLMEKVVAIGNTEKTIGVGASGLSLLRPRKSQCSFIALGSAENEITVKSEPCKPCLGKKCLYYQLGGCHMQAGL